MMPQSNYPIVLAQGIARFDFLLDYFIKSLSVFGFDIAPATEGLHYFKGIARYLREKGFDLYHTRVSFAARVETRAEDLRNEIEKILSLKGRDKVHIIAHSMGGLDARHMIVNLGMAEKVASLTTIGTPHLGTSFADWGLANGRHETVKLISRVIDFAGVEDLKTDACKEFNERARQMEASNGVVYQTYAAAEEQKLVFAPLQLSWQVINEAEGENDGLVSLTSQLWQSELTSGGGQQKIIRQNRFPMPADHLNEVGWWDINELRNSRWWSTNIIKAAQDYEQSIKDVYLKIAREVSSLQILPP
ncbi:MAG TPA: alpha/beta fold hydrolase [Pyrinomonadaceae bacterium]|nr:alpha/beta fold hydrolase [Pyrinomonadaceae bacterium]